MTSYHNYLLHSVPYIPYGQPHIRFVKSRRHALVAGHFILQYLPKEVHLRPSHTDLLLLYPLEVISKGIVHVPHLINIAYCLL